MPCQGLGPTIVPTTVDLIILAGHLPTQFWVFHGNKDRRAWWCWLWIGGEDLCTHGLTLPLPTCNLVFWIDIGRQTCLPCRLPIYPTLCLPTPAHPTCMAGKPREGGCCVCPTPPPFTPGGVFHYPPTQWTEQLIWGLADRWMVVITQDHTYTPYPHPDRTLFWEGPCIDLVVTTYPIGLFS